MSFIIAIVMGLIVGVIAKLIMPGRDPGGIIVTCLLGICGSVVATWLGQRLGWYAPGQGAGFIGGIVGAIILLAVYRLILRSRTTV
jgi:uncharacterized membrane protein YeaQ/YmgE (transglycosylase-associated protein family)